MRHCGPAWKESAYQGQRDARPIGGTTTPFGRDRLVPIGRPPSSSSAKQQGTKEKLFCFLRHRHHFLNFFEIFVIKIKLNELNFNFYFNSIHFAWKRTSFEVVNIWKREKKRNFEAFQWWEEASTEPVVPLESRGKQKGKWVSFKRKFLP